MVCSVRVPPRVEYPGSWITWVYRYIEDWQSTLPHMICQLAYFGSCTRTRRLGVIRAAIYIPGDRSGRLDLRLRSEQSVGGRHPARNNILVWAGGRWRERPLGGANDRSPRNYRPSLRITPKPAGRLIDRETPISRPRGVGLIV